MKIEIKNFVQDWKIKLRKCFRKDIRKTKRQKTEKNRENNQKTSPRSLTCKEDEHHKERTVKTKKIFINKIRKEYFSNLKNKNLQIERGLQVLRIMEKIYSH